jgi:hypothetical protein
MIFGGKNDARKPFKKPCMLVYANTTESDSICVLFTFNVHASTRKHLFSQKAHDSQTTDLWPIVVESQETTAEHATNRGDAAHVANLESHVQNTCECDHICSL